MLSRAWYLGSTSTPKGVMVSHGNLSHNLATIVSSLRAGTDTQVRGSPLLFPCYCSLVLTACVFLGVGRLLAATVSRHGPHRLLFRRHPVWWQWGVHVSHLIREVTRDVGRGTPSPFLRHSTRRHLSFSCRRCPSTKPHTCNRPTLDTNCARGNLWKSMGIPT